MCACVYVQIVFMLIYTVVYVSTFICVDDLAGDVSIADPHDCDHIQFKYNDI